MLISQHITLHEVIAFLAVAVTYRSRINDVVARFASSFDESFSLTLARRSTAPYVETVTIELTRRECFLFLQSLAAQRAAQRRCKRRITRGV